MKKIILAILFFCLFGCADNGMSLQEEISYKNKLRIEKMESYYKTKVVFKTFTYEGYDFYIKCDDYKLIAYDRQTHYFGIIGEPKEDIEYIKSLCEKETKGLKDDNKKDVMKKIKNKKSTNNKNLNNKQKHK